MSSLEIVPVVVTDFVQNCRIIGNPDTRQALVVDPGGDVPLILRALADRNWTCSEIWLTHSHLDHCGGVAALKRATGAPLTAHPDEKMMRANVRSICAMYGLPAGTLEDCPEPERGIRGGEVLQFGGLDFQVRFTPGHSPGHVVFYQQDLGVVLAGDTLFAGSIGRSDLPGGDHATLLDSLQRVLLKLPGATKVLPGHGGDTTIEQERLTNPFLQD